MTTFSPSPRLLPVLVTFVAFAAGIGAELRVPEDHSGIQQALNAAVPADTIVVGPGTYAEHLNFLGKDVRLRSAEGAEKTILDANGGNGVEMGPNGMLVGFCLTNAFGSALIVHGTGAVIRENKFRGNTAPVGGKGAAIAGDGSSATIERNLFQHNSGDDQLLSGVITFINTASPQIYNNVFVSNQCPAVNIVSPPGGGHPVIAHNTMVANRIGFRFDRIVSPHEIVFRNNLVVQNEIGVEASFGEPHQLPVWENNLVWGNTTDFSNMTNPSGNQGNLSIDPRFHSFERGEFYLRRESPAIDAASPSSELTDDFDGNMRPFDGNADGTARPDIGALEYIGRPRAPMELAALSGNTRVDLSWSESIEAEAYELKRSSMMGGPYVSVGQAITTNFVDLNVTNEATYFYVVSASNGFGVSPNSAEVAVKAGNFPPVAGADLGETLEDTAVHLSVLTNDIDPNGDAFELVSAGSPPNGTASIESTQILYTPTADFNGTNRWTYLIGDGRGGFATGEVQVIVKAVNDAPTVQIAVTNQPASPSTPTRYLVGMPLTLRLEAGDVDNNLAEVRVFLNSTLIGVSSQSPLYVTLTNLPIGVHSVYATAEDQERATTTSGTLQLAILPEPAAVQKTIRLPPNLVSSPAIAPDGTLYIGSMPGKLFSLTPELTTNWLFEALGEIRSSPAIGPDGTVYFGTLAKKFYAIRADGTLGWVIDVIDQVPSSPALAAHGTIYFASWKHLYAVDRNGIEQWRLQIAHGPLVGGMQVSSPAIGPDGTIYVGSTDTFVYAVHPEGTLKWKYKTGRQVYSSPAIGAQGQIYVGSDDGSIHAINPQGGSLWEFKSGGIIEASPVIAADGSIFVGNLSPKLMCLEPDGKLRWSARPAGLGVVSATAVLGTNGLVYFTSQNRLFTAFTNGVQVGSLVLPGGGLTFSSPTLVTGRLYTASEDGRLTLIRVSDSLAEAQWPMFRRDLTHTARDTQRGLSIQATGGELSLRVYAEPACSFSLEGTTDFQRWSELTNGVVPAEAPLFEQRLSAEPGHRFFRLRLTR